jgi:hypothetical protein
VNPDNAAEAHRSAVICAFLGVVGTAMGVVGFWSISDRALRVVQVIGICVNGAGLVVLARRGRQTLALSRAVFLAVLIPTSTMAWLVDRARAAHVAHWVPYEPAKLSVLTLAMIAPPGWWVGVVAMLMFTVPALVHHALLAPELRASMAEGEPFGIIAYSVFAFAVLGFKQRSYALNEELEHARADKMVLERVARVAMALRDLANTPLQTLELVRQNLLTGKARAEEQTELMARALARLRRLNDILVPYQTALKLDERSPGFDGELEAGQPRAGALAGVTPPADDAGRAGGAPTPRRRPSRRPPA